MISFFVFFPEIRDDLVLQMVSEPLPPPVPSAKSDSTPECDVDLDVTLEPRETPCEKEEKDTAPEPVASQSENFFDLSLNKLLK